MKKTLIILILIISTQLSAQGYQKTSMGVKTSLQAMNVEVQFITPEIVRILKWPENLNLNKQSLSVIKTPENVDLSIIENHDIITLRSKAMIVDLDLINGKVSYRNLDGELLFTEKEYGTQFTQFNDAGNGALLSNTLKKRNGTILS